jgi:integrase
VLSPEEARKVIDSLEGRLRLMGLLLYGTGLRLMELVRLRVRDVDFSLNQIIVRDGRGEKGRATILPRAGRSELEEHLAQVKRTHEMDLAEGNGSVGLPPAVEKKNPAAAKDWGWQYVFPSKSLTEDPGTGLLRRHHIHETTLQTAVKKAVRRAGLEKPPPCTPFATASPPICWKRATTSAPCRSCWAQGREHDHGLHACVERGRPRGS